VLTAVLVQVLGRLHDDLSTRADARRRRSAKARNRENGIADSAAGYGELASRGMVAIIDFGGRNWLGRPAGGQARVFRGPEIGSRYCLVVALEGA